MPTIARSAGVLIPMASIAAVAGMVRTSECPASQGMNGRKDGLVFRNVLATYTHLHVLGTPQWAEGFLGRVRQHRAERGLGKQ